MDNNGRQTRTESLIRIEFIYDRFVSNIMSIYNHVSYTIFTEIRATGKTTTFTFVFVRGLNVLYEREYVEENYNLSVGQMTIGEGRTIPGFQLQSTFGRYSLFEVINMI